MSLAGLRVVSFESGRAVEIAELVRRHDGDPRSAPSMREIALSGSPAAREFAERLTRGEIEIVVLLTGVGTRLLIEAIAPVLPAAGFAAALSTIVTVVRVPKPRAALAELGVRPTIVVPEPNTWRELLDAIDARGPVSGRMVAV